MAGAVIALAATGAALLAGATIGNAVGRAPFRAVLERVAIPLPPVHRPLAGLTVGFVTDVHLGPAISDAAARRAAALLAPERVDLLLLGGDYISESPRYAERAANALAPLIASTRFGTLAVLGNHDLANDAARVAAALRAAGADVLRNEARSIETDRGPLWVAGIDDALLGHPDPDAAFAAVPRGAPSIALWHQPDWAERSAAQGALLQLSGHSHGGQIRLPLVGAPLTPQGGHRFVAGIHHAAGMPVYTSRGLGVFRPPARFFCPPEVTLVTFA